MAVEWPDSAAKHGVPQADALYAIQNADVVRPLTGGRPGESLVLYIGHPHGQTDRYLEVIVAHRAPRTLVIFHVMPLRDLYRHLLD